MYFQVPFTLSFLCGKERDSDQNVNKVKIGAQVGRQKGLSHWKHHSGPLMAWLSRWAGMIQRGGLRGASLKESPEVVLPLNSDLALQKQTPLSQDGDEIGDRLPT